MNLAELKKKNFKEQFAKGLFIVTSAISIVAILTICFFLFTSGFPAIREIGFFKFVFSTSWNPSANEFGILTMIVGSFYVTAGCMLIAIPIGVLTAVFIAHFCPKKMKMILKQLINVLVGIPSIIYGFFGLIVIVPFAKEFSYALGIRGASGSGVFAASIILAIMILPTIINLSINAIESVPASYMDGALAVGAVKEQAVFKVIVPSAKNGITASIILGIGRAVGETMALALVVGNSATFPKSIFHSMETLTVGIVKELAYAQGLHRDALISIGLVLFGFILTLSIAINFLRNKKI